MTAHRPRLGRRSNWVGTAVSVLALLLAASACDSTSDASSDAPVDNAGLEAAKATVAKAAVRPTEIPVTAPIDKPAGPMIRPSAAASWPSSAKRSRRAAWVRLLPSAAI